jgi:MFS family permease
MMELEILKKYNAKLFAAKIAVTWYAFVEGFSMGNWAASIPVVKSVYVIDEGMLGNVLFAAAGGAITAVPFVTYASRCYGSLATTVFGSVMLCLIFPIIAIHSALLITLLVGAFLLGFSILVLNSSMNAQAVLLELLTSTPIIGYYHAVYAIGCVTGGVIGSIFFEFGFPLLLEYIVFSCMIILPNIFGCCYLFTYSEEKDINGLNSSSINISEKRTGICVEEVQHVSHNPGGVPSLDSTARKKEQRGRSEEKKQANSTSPVSNEEGVESSFISEDFFPSCLSRGDLGTEESSHIKPAVSTDAETKDYYTIVIVSCVLFIAYFAAASVGDWSVLYLRTEWDCSPLVAVLGYVGFQLSVAVGRFFSDTIVTVLGRQKLLVLSAITGGCGLLLASLASVVFPRNLFSLCVAIIGFIVGGLGLSVSSPVGVSIVGSRVDGFSPVSAIAIASSVGYAGGLVGPPILGNIAHLSGSVGWSFLTVSCMIYTITILAVLVPAKYRTLTGAKDLSDKTVTTSGDIETGSNGTVDSPSDVEVASSLQTFVQK